MRSVPIALAALSIVGVAGCGSSSVKDDSGIPSGAQTQTTVSTTAAPPAVDAAVQYKGTAVSPIGNAATLAKEPSIPKPSGTPPKTLVAKDLVVGQGAAAKSGDNITMRYVGVSYSTGKVFDASWTRQPNAFPFQLGQGAVIPGWDKGIVGMKVGGRRELVIPPADGYGASGQGSTIKPNETLVFVVDLTKIG